MRRLALLTIVVPLCAWAGQTPPRGKRTPRPKPTHLVVTTTVLEMGGVKATLSPGVPVAAAGAVPARGRVKVTVLGQAILSGTLEAAALGQRVLVDAELRSPDGQSRLGSAKTGGFVRLRGAPKARGVPPGMVLVETVGSVVTTGTLPADSVGTEARELVLKEDWSLKTSKPAELFAGAEVKPPAIAQLDWDTRLVKVEQKGEVIKVRTHGPFTIEGWTLIANVDDRQASDGEKPEPRQKPTHEVFVDAPLYAAGDGKKIIGTLRGGALVQAEKRLAGDPAPRFKVKVVGPTQVEGWVKSSDLRKLEDSVWSEETR